MSIAQQTVYDVFSPEGLLYLINSECPVQSLRPVCNQIFGTIRLK
jgi:hypothetical protein